MSSFRNAYQSVFMLMPVMALNGSFAPAYSIVKVNEGGYVNNPADKGGETYAGIARNFNPTWGGWAFIDFYKRNEGAGKQLYPCVNKSCAFFNKKWPDIQYLVEQFYEDRFNKNRFGEINSQKVANLLFDYHVHSQSIAIKAIQRLVGATPDGVMGTQTLAAINRANADSLFAALLTERKAFLEKVIISNAGYEQFRVGFQKRLAQFEQFITTPGGIATGVIVVASLATMLALYLALREEKKKKPQRLKVAA